ncbi:uncharacterized protein V6R79_005622 [Siganus canaliculatus]
MKLYLAVAVLMLAFVAHTEAQEETIEQKFATFNSQMSEFTRNLAEKAKTAMQDINTKSANWFQEQFQRAKDFYEQARANQ